MKDGRGVFYYPFPDNRRVRMYVRENGDAIEFRLWNTDAPETWIRHGWAPLDAIRQAADLYQGRLDPEKMYDLEIARAVLGDDG